MGRNAKGRADRERTDREMAEYRAQARGYDNARNKETPKKRRNIIYIAGAIVLAGLITVGVTLLEPAPQPGAHPVPERWRPHLREVVHRLVVGDYEGLERDGVIFDVDVPGRDMVKHWIEQQPELAA